MNLRTRRRALMAVGGGGSSGRLPSAYQEVEWIGTNGQQSSANVQIDTGYAPTVNPRGVFKIRQKTTGTRYCYGMYTTNTYPDWRLYTASGNFYYKWGNQTNATGFSGYSTTKWYEIDAGINLIVDGETKVTKTATDWSNNTTTIKMFYGGNVNCDFMEFSIYDGDALVCDLVPCYRKSDGRIGFYDIVREVFLTNSGALSTMVKGADVT